MWTSIIEDIAKAFAAGGDALAGKWMVVGSVASVLQGCPFAPNDLDLTFSDYPSLEAGLEKLALAGLLDFRDEIRTEEYGSGFRWHISRSQVRGRNIDVVFIANGGDIADSDCGDGIWEGGRLIWRHPAQVRRGEYAIAVAPLLVQFESQVRRGRLDRAAAIKQVLVERGLERDELETSLSVAGKELFDRL